MQTIDGWKRVHRDWGILTHYQRFESLVAFVLTVLIGVIIVVALYRLTISVFSGLVFGALDPLDHRVFQAIFGEIMTLLIALEFNHTLQYVVARHQSIIQTRVVLLIALLALARKFIILNVNDLDAGQLIGLASITLVLGVSYWLVRDGEGRSEGGKVGP
jgi:uncharacterized membrane protein (DUF373 family)